MLPAFTGYKTIKILPGDLIMQCEADQEKKPSYKESYLPPRRAATLQNAFENYDIRDMNGDVIPR